MISVHSKLLATALAISMATIAWLWATKSSTEQDLMKSTTRTLELERSLALTMADLTGVRAAINEQNATLQALSVTLHDEDIEAQQRVLDGQRQAAVNYAKLTATIQSAPVISCDGLVDQLIAFPEQLKRVYDDEHSK